MLFFFFLFLFFITQICLEFLDSSVRLHSLLSFIHGKCKVRYQRISCNKNLNQVYFFVGRLFIADTNNSLIRYIDFSNEEPALLTLELKGVQPPTVKSKSLKRLRRRSSADTQTVTVDGGSSNEGNLSIKISLPEEYHFSKVPFPLLIQTSQAC